MSLNPTVVVAVAGTAGTGSATLSWTAPSTGTPTAYSVWANSTAGVANGGTLLGTYPATVTSATVSGLVPGETYYFYVNTPQGGYSAASNSLLIPTSPASFSIVLLGQSNVPFGQAPSGTITGSSSGNLTLGTALDDAYGSASNTVGCWLYFPAAAFASGPAGYYWTVMSSTTVGTVYNLTYSGLGPAQVPQGWQNQPIASGSGSGFTQPTGSYATALAFLVPPNTLGNNGSIRVTVNASNNNSAGNKQFNIYYNSSTTPGGLVIGNTGQTTLVTVRTQAQVNNNGFTNTQSRVSTSFGASATSLGLGTVDSTQNSYIFVGLNIATATDWMLLQGVTVEAMPAS